MKNAMKKLMSLLLVAVLVVGMIPFAASADEVEAPLVCITVNDVFVKNVEGSLNSSATYADCLAVGGVDTGSVNVTKVIYNYNGRNDVVLNAGESILLDANAICYVYIWTENKDVKEYCYLCGEVVVDGSVHCQNCGKCSEQYCGSHECKIPETQPTAYKVNIYVNRDKKLSTTGTSVNYADCVSCVDTENYTIKGITYSVRRGEKNALKEGESVTLTADTDFFVSVERKNDRPNNDRPNNNWHDNDKNEHNNNHNNNWHDKNENTNKFPYNVYLNIYKNSLVGSPDKQIDITNGIALDGLVSLSEVKTVVSNYYSAKNSNGIGYDGLYLAKGNWVADYVADTHKYSEIKTESLRQNGYVYINVMISNATTKTTYTADSSNPKTGDSIYTAMTVMGISAAALASIMYFYNKKRMAM